MATSTRIAPSSPASAESAALLRSSVGVQRQLGQALPLVLVVLLLAGLLMAGAARLGVAVQERAAAQAAADAAALAGAAHGREAAARVAAADGARLVAFRGDVPAVEVVVERRGVRATARAEWRPGTRRMQAFVRHPVSCPPCLPTFRDPRRQTPSTVTPRLSPSTPLLRVPG